MSQATNRMMAGVARTPRDEVATVIANAPREMTTSQKTSRASRRETTSDRA